MATDPRKLAEIMNYRNILNDKDAVQYVIDAINAQSAEQLSKNMKVTVSVALGTGSSSIAKPAFNSHFSGYLKENITSLLSGFATYMDRVVASSKARAEEEAGFLGMDSDPVVLVPPVITSAGSADAVIDSAFLYNITADNVSGTGITSCVYSVVGSMPEWMSLDATTGALTGTPVTGGHGVGIGDGFNLEVKVTTNVGSDTKVVQVTYVAAS